MIKQRNQEIEKIEAALAQLRATRERVNDMLSPLRDKLRAEEETLAIVERDFQSNPFFRLRSGLGGFSMRSRTKRRMAAGKERPKLAKSGTAGPSSSEGGSQLLARLQADAAVVKAERRARMRNLFRGFTRQACLPNEAIVKIYKGAMSTNTVYRRVEARCDAGALLMCEFHKAIILHFMLLLQNSPLAHDCTVCLCRTPLAIHRQSRDACNHGPDPHASPALSRGTSTCFRCRDASSDA